MIRIQIADIEEYMAWGGEFLGDAAGGETIVEVYTDKTREEAIEDFMDLYGPKPENIIVTEIADEASPPF